jgi:hypothetical protein
MGFCQSSTGAGSPLLVAVLSRKCRSDALEEQLGGLPPDGCTCVSDLACSNRPEQVASERLETIRSRRRFRLDNEVWYNKFKHGNCLLPTSALFDVQGRYSVFHMLPREVRLTDQEGVLREQLTPSTFIKGFSSVPNQEVAQIRTESLFSPLQFLDDAGRVLDSLNPFR